jgi:hypothetical protein
MQPLSRNVTEGDSPVKLPIGIIPEAQLVPGTPEWDDFLQVESDKPVEFSFTNADGKVFYEIAYSLRDVQVFARMHKAISYKPTEYSSIGQSPLAD